MSGVKGQSGRKKSLATQVRDWEKSRLKDLPLMLDAIWNKGLGKIEIVCPECGCVQSIVSTADKECAFYSVDRILGKAKTKIDLETEVTHILTDEQLADIAVRAQQQFKRLTESKSDSLYNE